MRLGLLGFDWFHVAGLGWCWVSLPGSVWVGVDWILLSYVGLGAV